MIKFLLWLFLGLRTPERSLSITQPPPTRPGPPKRQRGPLRAPLKMQLFRQALVKEKGGYDLPALVVRPWRHAPPHKHTSTKVVYPQCGLPIATKPALWYGDDSTSEEEAADTVYKALLAHYADPYGRFGGSKYGNY